MAGAPPVARARKWPVPGADANVPRLPWAARFPLHAAACAADGGDLRALLAAGGYSRGGGGGGGTLAALATLDALDDELRAPLHYAAWNGLVLPVEALLAAGAAVDVRSGDRGATPAHFAAGMGHAAALRALLRGGADARAKDADAWTPLDLARQDLMRAPGAAECAAALADAQAAAKDSPAIVDAKAAAKDAAAAARAT